MSDAALKTDPCNLLRLTICPRCDYSLEGLPDAGVCPECGRPFDQSMVVVRCHGSDPATGTGGWGIYPMVAVLLLIFAIDRSIWKQPFMLVVLGYTIASAGINWIERFMSPRRGVWLLWIASEGMAAQIDFDPDSLTAIVRRWLPIAYGVAYGVCMGAPLVATHGWLFGTLFSLPLAGFMLLMQWISQPKPTISPTATRPGLMGWSQLNNIELHQLKPGRYGLKAIHSSWVHRRPMINVKIDCMPAIADQLCDRILQWSDRRVIRRS